MSGAMLTWRSFARRFNTAGFIAHRNIDDADEQDAAVLLARIVAALEQRQVQQVSLGNRKSLEHCLAQRLGRVAERQRQLCNADHRGLPGRSIRQRGYNDCHSSAWSPKDNGPIEKQRQLDVATPERSLRQAGAEGRLSFALGLQAGRAQRKGQADPPRHADPGPGFRARRLVAGGRQARGREGARAGHGHPAHGQPEECGFHPGRFHRRRHRAATARLAGRREIRSHHFRYRAEHHRHQFSRPGLVDLFPGAGARHRAQDPEARRQLSPPRCSRARGRTST